MLLKGLYTALVTPFCDSKLNSNKLIDLVAMAVEADISGVVPLGSTGETPALEDFEKDEVVSTVVKASKNKLTVIVGAGSNNTLQTIKNIQRAADLGADAVLIAPPYYNKPTPEGLKYHFLAIADSSALPIVLYHVPSRCGVGIPVDLVVKLSHHQNIVGIKEAGGDLWRTSEIVRRTEKHFSVLSGDDGLTLPIMSVGGKGVIAVISNIAPKMMKSMVDYALAGDFDMAQSAHQALAPLMGALTLESNPGPIKEAMDIYKMNVGRVRPPLAPVLSKHRSILQSVLGEIGNFE